MTQEELKAKIAVVENRVRCVQSDQSRDVKRVFLEHWRDYGVNVDRLRRLRVKRQDAEKLIEGWWEVKRRPDGDEVMIRHKGYKERIVELDQELDMIANASRIKRVIQIAREINKLSGQKQFNVLMDAKLLDAERATTARYLIGCLRAEIEEIKRLDKTYEKREAELAASVAAQAAHFERFLRNRICVDEVMAAAQEELTTLRAIKVTAKAADNYVNAMDEFTQMCESMPPDLLKFLLESTGGDPRQKGSE